MANLTEEQQAQVKVWAADGANLNEMQQHLRETFGITMTYLDVRLMLVDLGVSLIDRKPKPVEEPKPEPEAVADAPPAGEPSVSEPEVLPKEGVGKLNVTVDQVTLPTMMVSGKVTFSDGQDASWYVDQFGRLGLKGPEAGYRPPEADVPQFQAELDRLLMSQGM